MESGLPIGDLIERCLDGDELEESWRDLVRRYDRLLHAYGHRAVAVHSAWHRSSLALEDVANEAWFRLCNNDRRALRNFGGTTEGEWCSYLNRIVTNVVLDALRRGARKKEPPIVEETMNEPDARLDGLVDHAPDPYVALVNKEIGERFEVALRRAWRERSQCDRDVLICQLHFRDGLSAVKIAGFSPLGLTHKGIEKVVEKGKRVLQKEFGGPGARSRDLDPGDPDAGPVGDHWASDLEIQRFLRNLPEEASHRELRLTHLARCRDCRHRMIQVQEALLSAPTDAENDAYDAAHPEGLEARVTEVLGFLRAHDRRAKSTFRRLLPGRPPVWARAAVIVVFVACGSIWIAGVLDRDEGGQLTEFSEVGELALLRNVEYPLEAILPLRLGQSFADESSHVLRARLVSDELDESLRSVEEELMEVYADSSSIWSSSELIVYHNTLGHLKLARNRPNRATDQYKASLAISPDNAVALIGLAVVKFKQAESKKASPTQRQVLLEEAERLLARVDVSSHHFEQALYNRAQVALAAGDVARALELLTAYEEIDPESPWQDRLRAALEDAETPE